jgi:ribosomal protein L37E
MIGTHPANGMIDMRNGTCALCGYGEVIEATVRDFFGESGLISEPLAVTQEAEDRFFGGMQPDPHKRLGKLQQYVCRRCGYTQWFAQNPEDIPIGFPHETELLRGAPKGPPYR